MKILRSIVRRGSRPVLNAIIGTGREPRGTFFVIVGTVLLAFFCVSFLYSEEESVKEYRTDQNNDESLPWYILDEDEFPPEGSAHYISGELIHIDHTERKFVLRADRTDRQNRSHFDLPLSATMLPYGSIYYHGSPAALEDIPLGTHLHGQFYLKDPDDKTEPIKSWHDRITPEADFTRCFRLEDDFSYQQGKGNIWLIEKVDLEEQKLTAKLISKQGGEDLSSVFDLQSSTRVWQGNRMGDVNGLAEGQRVQFNLTWATLYGPGRIREIWIDRESRSLASNYQLEKHLVYQRQRGLAGWIDEVDNRDRIVTITFFGGVSEKLLKEFQKDDTAGVAVARRSLVTYDPVNDRKRGPILKVNRVEQLPGSSGVQIRVKPELLLEGFRPRKIVRVYPSIWPVIALPKEEQYFGRY